MKIMEIYESPDLEGEISMLRFGEKSPERSLENFSKIMAFAWPKFIESKSGLVFIVGEWNGSPKEIKEVERCLYMEVARSRCFDKTDYEASVNHYHVDIELNLKPTKQLKKVCRTIGEMWVAKLKKDFPEKHFRVYLDDTILRFHQIHEGESPWLPEKDFIQEIKKGKIVIWEI